jgi:drug/metabolite transporter (DMT)-like permease
MASGRTILTRILYWLGVLLVFCGIGVVLLGARTVPAPSYGPPLVWAGFLLGLVGLALTARGATMQRY